MVFGRQLVDGISLIGTSKRCITRRGVARSGVWPPISRKPRLSKFESIKQKLLILKVDV